ncbi:DeoR/GlpR family DNA-binding transcription regulator [Streptacidiphilus monticola]
MDKHARRNALLELLGSTEQLSVEEAAQRLDVSPATIRRDFDELSQQQLLVRTRGGARVSAVTYELPLRYKAAARAEEKSRIAAAAAALVEPGMMVGLNGGTTTTEVARAIALRLGQLPGVPDTDAVTLVTNALNIAHELTIRPDVKVVLTGGVARARSYELVGPLAPLVLGELSSTSRCWASTASTRGRASARNEAEAGINKILVERAERVIVVADATKVGQRAFARICGLDAVDTLVTDRSATDAQLEPFEAAGVKVIRA